MTNNNNNNNKNDVISQLYDKSYYPNDLISIIVLIVYSPIGLLLLVIRILLLFLFYLLIQLSPNLVNNQLYTQLLTLSLGILVKKSDKTNKSDANSLPYLIVSNHLTCFDYMIIRSIFSNSRLAITSSSTTINNQFKTNSLLDVVFNKLLFLNEKIKCKNDGDDVLALANGKFNLVTFPENERTNGKFGLLEFDNELFELIESDNEKNSRKLVDYLPVCLDSKRVLIDLCINNSKLNDLTQIGFTLFAPLTVFNVSLLSIEEKRENENVKQLVERIRHRIANGLNVICTNVTKDDVKNASVSNKCESNLDRLLNKRSIDYDTYKLIKKINEILPDIDENMLIDYIKQSQTRDIDSLITGLLDKQASMMEQQNEVAAVRENESKQKQSSTTNTSTNVTKKKILTYAERKTLLIEEARQRYLSKINKLEEANN